MRTRPRCERLEARENPAAVALDPATDVLSVVLDPGPHTVSVDTADPFSTLVSIDGQRGALVLTAPAGLPPLSVFVNGALTSRLVAQDNAAVTFAALGGAGDDTIFGGSGRNFIAGGPGDDITYAILPTATDYIDTRDGGTDHVFANANPANTLLTDGPALDPVVTFFRPDRLPGSGVLRQEADGVLYVVPTNNGSYFQLDPLPGAGAGAVVATYDLGDGRGRQTQAFSGVVALSYFGGSGADVMINNSSVREAAYGGAGDDFLLGGFGDVSILKGLAGSDSVLGRTAGRADLSGNAGSDTVVMFGPGVTTFRVGPEDAVVAGFTPGDLALSP